LELYKNERRDNQLEKAKEVTLEENQNLMVGLIVIMIIIKSFLAQKNNDRNFNFEISNIYYLLYFLKKK
jgi:hypothetical protein